MNCSCYQWGRRVLAITFAELKSFWGSTTAGVTLLVFMGLLGFFFYNTIDSYMRDSLMEAIKGFSLNASITLFSKGMYHIPLVLMLVTPLVTMRSLTPFSRGGGLSYLNTLPISPTSIILGQYLAAWASLALLCVLSLVPFAFLVWGGVGRSDLLLTTLLGLWSLSGSFVAIGILSSAAFPSPTGAALSTLGILGLLWIMGMAAPIVDSSLVNWWPILAFGPRISHFVVGLVDLNDLLYFALLAALALNCARMFLNLRSHSGAN